MTEATASEWTIVYHGPLKFKGRGEFLRLMLEDSGTPYTNSAEGIWGPESFMDAFRGVSDIASYGKGEIAAPDNAPGDSCFRSAS